jgi:hypothetical protein
MGMQRCFGTISTSLLIFADYNSAVSSDTSSSNDEFGGPSASSLKQLSMQLTQWRGLLPRDLQWPEDDAAGFPSPHPINLAGFNQPVDPNLGIQTGLSGLPFFTTDLDSEPVHYPFVYDIQVALLRTRYYHAKYMVYRPFIYKALHFPEQMTQEDAEGVAECLRASQSFFFSLFSQANILESRV